MKTDQKNQKKWRSVDIYKNRKTTSEPTLSSTGLLLKNLLKTNLNLLRTLDVSASVLF